MCNLYSITTNQAAIAALFRVVCPSSGDLRPIMHFEKGGSGSSGVRV